MSSDEQRKNEAAKVWCASLGEPSPEEQHDDALTSEYKGRSVRVDKVNGTVQNVKFGFAHVVLEDGTTANLKFEHLGKFFGHYRIWDSSTAEATASAALAVEAQAAEAAPLAPLTPPSTPKQAPRSPRDIMSPEPLLLHRGAAALELRAPPWPPHCIGAAPGGDRPLASCYSPGPFEPGGADALRQGVGVEDLVLAPDTGQGCPQSRRRLSYDDDGPGGGDAGREGIGVGVGDIRPPRPDPDRCRRRPGHPQDASLHATGAGSSFEPAPGVACKAAS